MTEFEIAEVLKNTNMYELAVKTNNDLVFTAEEKVASDQLDKYFKEVGERGVDPNHEIAAFITKAINEAIKAPPLSMPYLKYKTLSIFPNKFIPVSDKMPGR